MSETTKRNSTSEAHEPNNANAPCDLSHPNNAPESREPSDPHGSNSTNNLHEAAGSNSPVTPNSPTTSNVPNNAPEPHNPSHPNNAINPSGSNKPSKVSANAKKTAKQAVQFALLGAVNAVVNYATYLIALTLGAHWLLASVLGYVVSVFNAWIWQYFVVFREGGHLSAETRWWKSLIKTYITYATTGLILTNILLFLMLDLIHIENFLYWVLQFLPADSPTTARDIAEYIAPLIAMVINVPINFLLNKFWAFREKPTQNSA